MRGPVERVEEISRRARALAREKREKALRERERLREAMPETAAFVRMVREVFGTRSISALIARENGETVKAGDWKRLVGKRRKP